MRSPDGVRWSDKECRTSRYARACEPAFQGRHRVPRQPSVMPRWLQPAPRGSRSKTEGADAIAFGENSELIELAHPEPKSASVQPHPKPDHLHPGDGVEFAGERLLGRLVPNAARPAYAPGVPPNKASSNSVDSEIRRLPRSTFALSIPKAAKMRKFMAISTMARSIAGSTTSYPIRRWSSLRHTGRST